MLLVQPIYSDIRDGLWHWVYNITQSLTVSHSHTLFSCHLHRAKLWMFVASYLLVRFVHSFDPWFGSGWTKWCWYLVDIKDIPCYVIIYIYIIRFFWYSTSIMQEENLFMVHPAIEIVLRHCYQDAKLQPVAEGDQAVAWIGENAGVLLFPSGKLSHNCGKSPFLMGISSINGPFSIAMLNYQRVMHFIWILLFLVWMVWVSAVFMEDDSISRCHVCVLFAG